MTVTLSHVAIFVTDLAESARFYAGMVGAEQVRVLEIPEFGTRNGFVQVGDKLHFELVEMANGGPLRVVGEEIGVGQQMMAMDCADLDATIRTMRTLGAEVAELPPTATLAFRRGWVKRGPRGDFPMELNEIGSVPGLIAASPWSSVDSIRGRGR
jgi:predicted enzyme related to lactoylglutathione lyase